MLPVCSNMASEFISGDGRLMLVSCDASVQQERVQRLQRIYLQAGKLFTRLHAQQTELRWQQAELLKREFDGRCMRPHPLQSEYAEEEELAQGKYVNVVVGPAVSRIRRADGEAREHFLVRAVVCLSL
jgi:hypothetical protein